MFKNHINNVTIQRMHVNLIYEVIKQPSNTTLGQIWKVVVTTVILIII